MRATFSAAAALAATFSLASAANSIPTCGANSQCPSDTPCCSQYGQCGVGAYCLGGCNPRYSHDLQSCVAAPTCQSADYKLNSLDDVQANTVYLGDSSKANWVSSGTPVVYQNDAILLTMAPNTVGTLLMSTHYVWYGQISATMTTSQGAGVVTAFIMMSDVQDEIDFEFVGVELEVAQSNYYFQGITDYGNEQPLNVSNTVQNTHTYTIDWQPDSLTWSIDGIPLRTLNRNDTWNSNTQNYHYPQSPSRIQLSLWPAGLQSNGAGTVAWAGGLVDWNSQYMLNGYYYALVSEVKVQCYNPPSGFSNNHGSKAYYYDNSYGTNDTVATGNNSTELASFFATGDNPSVNPNAAASGTAAAPKNSATPETVPGVSGGGAAGIGGTDSSGNAQSGTAAGSAQGSQSSAGSGGSTTFQQGLGGSGTSQAPPKLAAGSAVALLGFFVACLLL
ncbi:putative glycosidase CRH2 [Friedmanniomyces endolithicus]|nr:putative glycosidase CRH2 [Friedmanniomyces endolithicus]KAK0300807.1 putative glycosidase CRH2 [Friedmanniomyces endolithicus]KAK1017987.1 putative glycosidase CRH2 [Friedmanniomyces endolithicus]